MNIIGYEKDAKSLGITVVDKQDTPFEKVLSFHIYKYIIMRHFLYESNFEPNYNYVQVDSDVKVKGPLYCTLSVILIVVN